MPKKRIASFTDLKAWQVSHAFTVQIYKVTNAFPESEKFGLINQIRRAAVSIVSNIVEGFSRDTKKDKLHFYSMGIGSLAELQSQLLIARDIGYLPEKEFNELAEKSVEVRKLLYGLRKSATSRRG